MARFGYECCACGQLFSSDYSFRKHRTGSYGDAIYDAKRRVVGYTKSERRCYTVDEMVARGFVQGNKDKWSTGTFDADKAFRGKEGMKV